MWTATKDSNLQPLLTQGSSIELVAEGQMSGFESHTGPIASGITGYG